ncbi:hypothetical protein N9L68_06215 [bacterium]|nr:hypothetical protein [bacterium]
MSVAIAAQDWLNVRLGCCFGLPSHYWSHRSKTAPRRCFPELSAGGAVFEHWRMFRSANPMAHGAWFFDGKWGGPARGSRGGGKGSRESQRTQEHMGIKLARKRAREAGTTTPVGKQPGSGSK